jgi:hypothetical protein
VRVLGEIFIFFNLKNRILTHPKGFLWKKKPNSLNSIFFFEIARFLQQVPAGSLKNKKQLLKNSTFISSM